MVMKRYPHGASGEFFFMKRAPSPRPDWIELCSIEHESGNVIDFPMIQDRAALLWVINLGCIDLNQWYARCDDVNRPDYLHFDLDPGKGWGEAWRPIESLCVEWRSLMNAMREFESKQPGRVLYVRLEDLSARPRRELNRIARFLGLPTDDAQGEVEEEALLQPFETWKADALKPADSAIANRAGRSQLDAYDRWRVQTLLAPELKAFKYADPTVTAPPMDPLHRKLVESIDWYLSPEY